MENFIYVLTGDLVDSTGRDSAVIENRLREISKEIEQKLFGRKKTFEIYRGDSFQALIQKPEELLRVMLLWVAGIRATRDTAIWSVRIAAGIGRMDRRSSTLASSSGSGFVHSGTMLDELKQIGRLLGFRSGIEKWDAMMEAYCRLADALIDRWTPAAAEAVYAQLLHAATQEQLAAKLGIAQSSVHKRLQTANWSELAFWEITFRNVLLSYHSENQ